MGESSRIRETARRRPNRFAAQKLQKPKEEYVPPKNPAKVGKADPVRDMCIFAGFIAFMLFFALKYENVGKPAKNEKPQAGTLDNIKKSLNNMITEAMSKRIIRDDCDLFLAQRSLPGMGYGIFAGKNYTQGEVISRLSSTAIPLQTTVGDRIFIHPITTLLNHHPELVNIQSTKQLWTNDPTDTLDGTIHASRDIQIGEELFLEFQPHPHSAFIDDSDNDDDSIFATIPRQKHYDMADLLIEDARQVLKARTYNTPKRRFDAIAGSLYLGRTFAARFDKRVADIVPKTAEELLEYSFNGSSVLLSMRNSTQPRLSANGRCFDDATIANASSEGSVVAKREIQAGGIVMHVPLFAIDKEDARLESGDTDDGNDDTCPTTTFDHCFWNAKSSKMMCPTSAVAIEFMTEDGDESSSSSSKQPNVYVRLSDRSVLGSVLSKKRSVPAALSHISSAIEFVAIRDIGANEKLLFLNNDEAMLNITSPTTADT